VRQPRRGKAPLKRTGWPFVWCADLRI